MKVFAFLILTPDSPQLGLREALASMGSDYCEMNWWPYYQDNRIRRLRADFKALVSKFQPDFTFLQLQAEKILLKEEFNAISGFRMQWTGDLRVPTPQHYFDVAKHVELSCFSNELDVKALRAKGFDAEFLNTGFSTTTFKPQLLPKEGPKIVFMGNNYPSDPFPCSQQRRDLVSFLSQNYHKDFQVYGKNWGKDVQWLTEEQEARRYNQCLIAINQNHFDNVERFTSDRLLRAMGSGAMTISNHYPGIEKDFEITRHLDVYRDHNELKRKIDGYLANEALRHRVAEAGCKHVHDKHNWHCRIGEVRGFMEGYGVRGQ